MIVASVIKVQGLGRTDRRGGLVFEAGRGQALREPLDVLLQLLPSRSRGRRSQTVSVDCLTVCHPRDRLRLGCGQALREPFHVLLQLLPNAICVVNWSVHYVVFFFVCVVN